MFTTLTGTARIPWATTIDSLGEAEWSTAVGLATGSFAAGSTPGIQSGMANVYTALGTSTNFGPTVMVDGASFVVHPNRIFAGVPGDYSDNGVVDAADYTVWRDHLGQTFQLTNEGPFTPGEVTAEDYTFWKEQFGLPGAGSGAVGVPEPTGSQVPEPNRVSPLVGGLWNVVFAFKTWAFTQVSPSVKKAIISVETA